MNKILLCSSGVSSRHRKANTTQRLQAGAKAFPPGDCCLQNNCWSGAADGCDPYNY